MHILIVEDERPIAKYIERLCRQLLGTKIRRIDLQHSLEDAASFLFRQPIDLCLLDLNLNGEDGYELLKLAVSGSFHTIIISANTDKAVEAFRFGVLDFIPKPFDEARLSQALQRYFDRQSPPSEAARYLTVRKENQNILLPVREIVFFKAAGIYVEAYLKNGRREILDKTMDRLGQILPANFLRIHRSYFVDLEAIGAYRHTGGGTYQVTLKDGRQLPLSRQKYKELHELLNE